MERSWTKWVTTLGGVASIVVLATAVCDPDSFTEEPAVEPGVELHSFQPWSPDPLVEEEIKEALSPISVEKPDGEARWVQVVDGEDRPVESKALIGSAGMWPFVTTESDGSGFLALPTVENTRMDGGNLELYELLVRSKDDDGEEQYGFWGLVHGPGGVVDADEAQRVRMEQAAPLEFVLVDADGEPIDEAYVRISRDSVGLVHMHQTTGEDGRAQFRAIPAGTYYLTLDASGHQRTTHRIEHSPQSSMALHITLEDGSGVRAHQSWRRPSLREAVARSEARAAQASREDQGGRPAEEAEESTGGVLEDDPGASEHAAAEESEHVGGATVEIAIRVDNERGSAVEDAWIEAWVGGSRVAQGRSRGWDREVIEVPTGATVDIVATHTGWGEGTAMIANAADGDSAEVRLTDLVPARTPARDRLVWIGEIEEVLDADVVETGRGLRLDPQSGGAGARAGIERGDSLYFVRRQGSGHLAMVERDGEFVEIAIP